jgi:hypothetical protein
MERTNRRGVYDGVSYGATGIYRFIRALTEAAVFLHLSRAKIRAKTAKMCQKSAGGEMGSDSYEMQTVLLCASVDVAMRESVDRGS